MIIYSHVGNYVAGADTLHQRIYTSNDVSKFMEEHVAAVLVTYNGEADKKKYPGNIIFSAHPENTLLEWCNDNGYNIETNNLDELRTRYEVNLMVNHYEEIIKDVFDLYTNIIRQYKLSARCYRMPLNQLIKEVMRWK